MKYLFEQEPLNPVSLQKELGLNQGDISALTVYPDGAVEVETTIGLTDTTQTALKTALQKRGLPKGKKPVTEA